MTTFTKEHAKLLYMRFCVIYGDKFAKTYHDEAFRAVWCDEWVSALHGINIDTIKPALVQCKQGVEWPPSIAEFRSLCERQMGMPDIEQAYQCALRRDYAHPVIWLAYQKVGSWAMRNDPEKQLRDKFTEAYNAAVIEYRENPLYAQQQLDNARKHLDDDKQTIEHKTQADKPLTQEERISWRDRFAQYQAKAVTEQQEKQPQRWDDATMQPNAKNYDQELSTQYKRDMCSMSDLEALILALIDAYIRTRLLREREAYEKLAAYRMSLGLSMNYEERPKNDSG